MAQVGDKVCRMDPNRGPIFGRIVQTSGSVQAALVPVAATPPVVVPPDPTVPALPLLPATPAAQNLEVQWEGNDTPTPLTEFPYQTYDRSFQEGERVIRGDGSVGKVVRVSQAVTLAIHGSEFVIKDIDVDRLHPVVALFPGVKVLHDGWVGQIVELKRRIRLQYADGTQFLINEENLVDQNAAVLADQNFPNHSTEIRLEQEPNPDPGLINAYPYSQFCRIPLIGQIMTFKWLELKLVDWQVPQTFWGFYNRPYWLGCRYRNQPARVTAVEVREVTVEWEEQLTPGPMPEPNTEWSGQRVAQLLPLSVPKTLYFFPNSLMLLRVLENDMASVVHIRDWEKDLCDPNSGGPAPPKVPRLDIVKPCAAHDIVTVRGLLLMNKVTVDYGDGEVWTGLTPALTRDPNPTHPFIPLDLTKMFVIKKRHLDPTPGKFGINKGLSRDNPGFLEVNWYQELHGNAQAAVAELGRRDAPVLDLDFPESYNWFTPGMLVAKSAASARDFMYATVKQVHRNGRISLLLTKSDPIEVWPYEIERCGNFAPSVVYNVVPDPRATFGLLRNIPAPEGILQKKWECLKEMPEANYFAHEPEYIFGKDPSFSRVLLSEIMELQTSLPEGVWVKSYTERFNIISVLMKGTDASPYEGCLFPFEIYLPEGYPHRSPKVHFVRMTTVNLGEDLSSTDLLDIERLVARLPPETHGDNLSRVTGGPKVFSIATVILAIRHELFVTNPYTRVMPQPECAAGALAELTRQYNQEVFIGVLDSIYEIVVHPPEPWIPVIRAFYAQQLTLILQRLRPITNSFNNYGDPPRFPLLPLTTHARASIERRIEVFDQFSN